MGLRRFRAYRKEWDEGRGVWKDRPRHDEASHGADAFLTFACSNYQPPSAYVPRKRRLRGIVWALSRERFLLVKSGNAGLRASRNFNGLASAERAAGEPKTSFTCWM